MSTSTLRYRLPALSVGITAADLMHLGTAVRELESCGAVLAHFDVMDGVFAPQLTVGPFFVKGVKTSMFKDVHLMVADSISTLDACASAGADTITVHVESCAGRTLHALQRIGELTNVNDAARGILCGVAINPGTPVVSLEPLLAHADMVTLLAIEPGVAGQKFHPATIERSAEVRALAARLGVAPLLCIDGGVTRENIALVAQCRADMVVSGSAVFGGEGPRENLRIMTAAIKQ